jgi:hypothetical protein
MIRLSVILFLLFSLSAPCVDAETIPAAPANFLDRHCLDCHDRETRKGEVNLEFDEIDWRKAKTRAHWERVLNAIAERQMPPKKKAQPSDAERSAVVAWLDRMLTKHSPAGGTVARRLNRQEYLATIEQLFGVSFELPLGFPEDTEGHGFDNVGESLILSPPLLNAYAEMAATVADRIFPPIRPAPASRKYHVPAKEMVISYSSGSVRDGAMRLAIQDPVLFRSCTWPTKVELPASGVYRVKVSTSQFSPNSDAPMTLRIYACDSSGNDGDALSKQRVIDEFTVTTERPETIELEAEFYEGQTVVCYWADAPLAREKKAFEAYLRRRFSADQRLLAAWQQVEHTSGLRGGLGWERVKALMADKSLDLSNATMVSKETDQLIKLMLRNPVLYYETIAFDHFENGPALEIHSVDIEGPIRMVDGPKDRERQGLQAQLVGRRGDQTERQWTEQILRNFLAAVFRRPVDEPTLGKFTRLVATHRRGGNSFEKGIHLAVRTALISPRFLYRALKPGRLDDYDLASRLSYFLKGAPPDSRLLGLAGKGRLSNPGLLRKEAERLMPKSFGDTMIKNFTGQWLDLRLLDEIMPDARLKLGDREQAAARQEVEKFFVTMLLENRPMTDFIDPDFTFATGPLAKNIYGITKGINAKSRSLQRVTLPRGGRYGGVLGQAGVLIATANGVDTQPVVRGVWVLENIIGDPPPPPPQAVPAITPDTTGARTPRELLKAHASVASCAACHKKIDPLGFALENFDAVGRWREHYPIWELDQRGQPTSKPGAKIDSSGQLPDGTKIGDIIDLKKWIVANIDRFSECLSGKLLTYACGRVPEYSERQQIARLVAANHQAGNGFRDLLLALIDSEIFRTK